MILGIFPSFAMTFRRAIVSSFPITSSRILGLYFSIHGILLDSVDELEVAVADAAVEMPSSSMKIISKKTLL